VSSHELGWLVLTYLCGAAYELGCVFWVHYSESEQTWKAVRWSCFNALVTIIGIEGALQTLPLKVAFVLGFGSGTYLAINLKRKMLKS
jgi:hypothetical protein